MAEETIISWTPTNWITVVLMVALGYLLFALVWQAFSKYSGRGAASA